MFNKIILSLIKFYQRFISPFLGPRCRFYPTCSEYCYQSFREFSFLRAMWYSLCRISKCHPLHSGGVDPLPEKCCRD